MEHRGHTIAVMAKADAAGRCCDASYIIRRLGAADSLFAGVIAGIFDSVADAEAAALRKAQDWIDQNLGALGSP